MSLPFKDSSCRECDDSSTRNVNKMRDKLRGLSRFSEAQRARFRERRPLRKEEQKQVKCYHEIHLLTEYDITETEFGGFYGKEPSQGLSTAWLVSWMEWHCEDEPGTSPDQAQKIAFDRRRSAFVQAQARHAKTCPRFQVLPFSLQLDLPAIIVTQLKRPRQPPAGDRKWLSSDRKQVFRSDQFP